MSQNNYILWQNSEGEFLLIVKACEQAPDFPLFLYDGSDTALLLRSMTDPIALHNIELECRMPLIDAKEVHVIETKDGTVDPDNPEDCIVRDYIAIVRIVADVNEMIVR